MSPARLPKLPNPTFDFLPFTGGLDTETPNWQIRPGRLRTSENYEVNINGGYEDIQGFERSDGRPSPSDAVYSIIDVNITGSFSDGDAITQLVSGATAIVVNVDTVTTTNDYLVITKIAGTFNNSDDIQVSAVTEGAALTTASAGSASTTKLDATYDNLAADEFRGDILVVPGSGDILGLWMLDDTDYAFRNNAGGTAADVYKSSSSGWTQVALGFELPFTSGGVFETLEGNTITGAISGATAVITRVPLESGSFTAGTAAGRFIFASQTGTFQAENLDVGADLNVATIAGDSTAITLLPNGRYEFITANFGGQTGTRRIYGCDKVNRGFEFDGTVFTPIDTAITADTPSHVAIHKNHLFFSFDSSAQHSGIGTPFIWSAIFGAAELATGDIITGFMSEPGDAAGATLGIYNRNTIHMLYGSSVADWNLVRYRDEIGAFEYSIQQFGTTLFLDDRGITNLQTVQAYGNFQHATISTHIQRIINDKRTLIAASCIARDKNQFRLFFSDGFGLYITTVGQKVTGIMPVQFPKPVRAVYSLEDTAGNEVIKFGSNDGFVYQLDKGTSFDGDNLDAFLTLHFHYSKTLRTIKKYLGVTIEAEGLGFAEFSLGYQINYGNTNTPQPTQTTKVLSFSSAVWDTMVWDAFIWDGETLSPGNYKLTGSGENISISIRKSSDFFVPIAFSGALLRFIVRRQLR